MKELYEKRAALKAQLDALLGTAKTENRAMTDDESKEFDRLESEIRALDETIAREDRARNIADEPVPSTSASEDGKNDGDNTDEVEARAFLDYLRGKEVEMRAGEQNVTMANNSAIIPSTIANKIIDTITDICPILAGADRYHVKGTLKIPKWTLANSTHDVTVGYASEFTELTAGAKTILYGDYSGLSVNFREDIGIEVLREAYHTQHAVGIDTWFEFDSKVTDEQKLAVLVQKAS